MLGVPMFLACITAAQTIGTAEDYQVKAAFLFNFTQFVEWPEDAFADDTSPLVVAVLGEDPFGGYLDKLLEGEKVNGHPLEVRRYSPDEKVEGCHVLFIKLKSKEQLEEALEPLKNRSILTVSDMADFTRYGGMIQFFLRENRIRIRISPEPASDADLVVSSKLLRLAEIEGSGNRK